MKESTEIWGSDDAFVVHASVLEFLEAEKKRDVTSSGKHPAVSFYLGESPLKIVLPSGQVTAMTVIELHLQLLPPTCRFELEEDRLADTAQVETTRRNWHMLVTELLPTFCKVPNTQPADADPREALSYAAWVALRSEAGLMDRMHYSYSVILHFYGWRLHDQETGELDRHKNWTARYKALEDDPAAVDKYYSYITWILRHLLEFLLTTYAQRLGLFLLDEFGCGRLLLLRGQWDRLWRPMLLGCAEVDDCGKQQLRKREKKLDHSDSD